MPNHRHTLQATDEEVDRRSPDNRFLAEGEQIYAQAADLDNMAEGALQSAGGGQPHNNMQPYLAINFIIALTGLYPSRS